MAAKIKLDEHLGKIINFFSNNIVFPINVFITTAEGKLVWVSDRLLKEAKVEKLEAILHKHIRVFGEIASEGIRRVVNKRKEEIIAEEHNSNYYITCRYPIMGKGNVIDYVFGISFNINKVKQADIAKQEFLKNMAHDIRTPLSGVIGLAQIQQMGLESLDESKEYGQIIYETSNQLLELLNAVIETIDTEQMVDPVKMEPLDLSGLAKELRALMEPSVYTRGLRFILDIDQDLPIILSDRIKLKRVLLNILSNSVKFTKAGEINFIIRLLAIENNSAKVEIRITDTGIGIAEENLDKIFDRFYRAHPSYLAEYTGYGIGLYLAKETLDLLDGEIKVASEEGKGSCFTLHFKFPLANKNLTKAETVLEPTKEIQARTGAVLIAEDNAIVLRVVKNQLEKAGYEVIPTMDGQAALEVLKTKQVVWALLDIGLPELRGTEACKQYRKWKKENNRPALPIFVLTGHQVEEVQKECDEAGIDRVFTKPFKGETLEEIELFINNLVAIQISGGDPRPTGI